MRKLPFIILALVVLVTACGPEPSSDHIYKIDPVGSPEFITEEYNLCFPSSGEGQLVVYCWKEYTGLGFDTSDYSVVVESFEVLK